MLLVIVACLSLSGDTPQTKQQRGDYETYRKRKAEQNVAVIPDVQAQTKAQSDTANNECKPQEDKKKGNGEECENNGYHLMEKTLKYRRLINPPKSIGIDGLFEKVDPDNQPMPFPSDVQEPKLGKVIFEPDNRKPPGAQYYYQPVKEGEFVEAIYPKFVVFEAKNSDKRVNTDKPESIKSAARRALSKDTCDGTQMGAKWVENRIPKSLRRDSDLNAIEQVRKELEIKKVRYARWIFFCLPGPIGENPPSKVFVFIDVVEANMNLDMPEEVATSSNNLNSSLWG